MEKRRFFSTLSSGVLFLVGLAIVVFGWSFVLSWYLGFDYLPGVDFYVTATHVRQLIDNFNLPPLVWKYFWYSGYPFSLGYLIFPFYLAVPFVLFFGLIRGIQAFALFSLLLFALGCYILYCLVSKNKLFAAILAVATVFSANLYGSLLWAGAIPSFFAQAFLPFILFFLIFYFQKKKRRWLYLASLFLGLAILAHPRVVLIHILPISFFYILFFPYSSGEYRFGKRLIDGFVFYFSALLVGIIQAWPLLPSTIGLLFSTTKKTLEVATGVGEQAARSGLSSHPKLIWAGTNQFLFIGLGVLIIPFLIRLFTSLKEKKESVAVFFSFLATFSAILFLVAYIYACAAGLPVPKGGWYRATWSIPPVLALLLAQFYGQARELLGKKQTVRVVAESVVVLISAGLVFYFSQGMLGELAVWTDERRDVLSAVSANRYGAYPYYINSHFSSQEIDRLKKELMPDWVKQATRKHRLYELDATINVWWNALFDTRLALGYIDPPLDFDAQGYWFWMKQALNNDGLVEDWEKSDQQAVNNSRFLLDWHGIGVIEAGTGHDRVYHLPLSTYLQKERIVAPGEDVLLPDNGILTYYQVKPENTSPILEPLDTYSFLVISNEEGFELLTRAAAYLDLGTDKLIFVRESEFLDDFTVTELKNFDGVILYNYQYQDYQMAWDNLLDKYVKNEGGRIFIDTGSEVAESESGNLPPLFPMKKVAFGSLSTRWSLEAEGFGSRVKLSAFSPPLYDGDAWKFSHVDSSDDLFPDTKVILKNQGKPVLLVREYGNGKVIWSGLNLPYHINRYDNFEEARLLETILGRLPRIPRESDRPLEFGAELNPRSAWVSGDEAPAGILFREQFFPGWSAKIKTDGQTEKLKIYKAGPIIPGFIYTPIPSEKRGKSYRVEFVYRGDPQVWFLFSFNLLTIGFVLDKGLADGWASSGIYQSFFAGWVQKLKERWESEEI